MTDVLRIYVEKGTLKLELSLLALLILAVLLGALFFVGRRFWKLRRFRAVEVEIALGNVGKVTLQPNIQDIQIAHKIWVELTTRKAAVPLDEDHDVLVEVYDSWFALFQNVRTLLAEVPGSLIRTEHSTQELARIATETLNKGLRPHLTRWQARFRSWWEQNQGQLATKTPQELQREFPQYAQLIQELRAVNQDLRQYADALGHIVKGS